jgi:predicted XRE-type DNA-binding protein
MAKNDHVESTGNVFADFGFADAAQILVEAEFAQKTNIILQKRRLPQVQAAAILDVDQPKVSALLCGRLSRFSVEKLLQILLLLGKDVAITIKPRQRTRTRANVRGLRRGASDSKRGRLTVVDSAPLKASGV